MKRDFRQLGGVGLAVILILFAAVYLYSQYEEPKLYHVLSGDQKHQEMQPVGELLEGVSFSQSVDLQQIRQVGREWAASSLCLEVLMANYSNRANTGKVRVGVALDGRVETLSVAAETVQDNAYHRVNFENVTLADVYAAHEMQILLEGVDSKAGSAVTAWSTQDVSMGRLDTKDEKMANRSLLLHIGFVTESPKRNLDLLVLAFIAFVAIYILISQPGGRNLSGCSQEVSKNSL
jgi:hypothetical protein